MYVLTQSQSFFPILALLIFFGVFVAALVRSFFIKREDAEAWAQLALESDEEFQNPE